MTTRQSGSSVAASKSDVPVPVTRPAGTRRLTTALPVIVFAVVAVFLGIGLTLNPKLIPSVLIGQKVPEFDLLPVKGAALGLSSKDLKGEVSLVNVWASWCTECRREHPLFMDLAARGVVPIHGLNYKDLPDDARNWLDTLGDPYARNGADRNGRAAIDLGVYGVPETFVIDQEGRIVHKHIGALTPETLKDEVLELVKQLREPKQ